MLLSISLSNSDLSTAINDFIAEQLELLEPDFVAFMGSFELLTGEPFDLQFEKTDKVKKCTRQLKMMASDLFYYSCSEDQVILIPKNTIVSLLAKTDRNFDEDVMVDYRKIITYKDSPRKIGDFTEKLLFKLMSNKENISIAHCLP